jgi:hypothetical protein
VVQDIVQWENFVNKATNFHTPQNWTSWSAKQLISYSKRISIRFAHEKKGLYGSNIPYTALLSDIDSLSALVLILLYISIIFIAFTCRDKWRTRPLVREEASQRQNHNCLYGYHNLITSPRCGSTDWPSVVTLNLTIGLPDYTASYHFTLTSPLKLHGVVHRHRGNISSTLQNLFNPCTLR